ncbi:MAG TPA: hypothetical protein PLS24_10420, partial [Sedimentisphaerales bacterium]|nr:hypothetical protein [Sedimentisphaerales bacterium]
RSASSQFCSSWPGRQPFFFQISAARCAICSYVGVTAPVLGVAAVVARGAAATAVPEAQLDEHPKLVETLFFELFAIFSAS